MTTPTPHPKPWPRTTWAALLAALTLCTLCVHGYHPLAEDGGLYVAGVQYKLDPSLFPHYTDFVREHLHFSVFAPTLAAVVRLTHLPLAWVLLLTEILSIWLTLFAARQILRRAIPASDAAQLAGISLLAAWWTLPIAGTSLLLMDPYVTARSLSTPLSLLAIAFALDENPSPGPLLRCTLCLLAAAAFHPLMAAYALAFIIVLLVSKLRRRTLGWTILAAVALTTAALLQMITPPESPALQAAAITRYYWFLSQWQWYERLGLLGPPVMLSLLLIFRRPNLSNAATTLCRSCIALAAIATLTALLFAHESSSIHLVARLQVLRVYLPIYALMAMLLGATLYQLCNEAAQGSPSTLSRKTLRITPTLFLLTMAAIMAFVQRQTYTSSPEVELPWRAAHNPNPWVQAFLWAKSNTPQDALFALDAKYVNTDGEDAQTFRATSLRSALPDYSKDGGEASITPALAPVWQPAAAAQKDLSQQPDAQRDAHLQPFAVTWMVLHSTALTVHPCPYDNGTVKVCRLIP